MEIIITKRGLYLITFAINVQFFFWTKENNEVLVITYCHRHVVIESSKRRAATAN